MIIDEYIARIEEAIDSRSEKKQEKLLEEIFSVFKNDIPDIRAGTTYESSFFDISFEVNGMDNPLPTKCNYRNDLKLILRKIKKYRETLELQNQAKTVVNNSTNINISNSVVKKSNIASQGAINNSVNQKGKKPPKVAIIATIIGILAGIAGIITAIIEIVDHMPKK